MSDVITTLVGEEVEGHHKKWEGTLAAPNGCLYGTPCFARRVAKFNPVDKFMTFIGPDFGDGVKCWQSGAINDSGVIYCIPQRARDRGILKIDTNTDNVTELDKNLLPERGHNMMWSYGMWKSCAAALDGCIYFMPAAARYIMKLDPNNNDAMSSVGDDLGVGSNMKYVATVVGIDGCVYGIPCGFNRILKYDPINDITSFVGEEADEHFLCIGNGVLARDGCIYAITRDGRVLKIDTTNNCHGFVVNSIDSDHNQYRRGWCDAVMGIDGCVYWPPYDATRTLKYNPHIDLTSLVGGDFGTQQVKWVGGTLASDRVVYCFPTCANQVLAIDPIGEFLATTKVVMQDDPEESF